MFRIAALILMVLTSALTAFTPMTISAQEQIWSANGTLLSEDTIIRTLQLKDRIRLDTTLVMEVDNAFKAAGSTDDTLASYYPFHIGNSWTYGTHTKTIIDTQRIEGNLYFLFENGTLKRMTDDNKLVIRRDSVDQMWVDFNANIGDNWRVNDFIDVTLSNKEEIVEVPAGTFIDCYAFVFSCGSDCGMTQWYAPGVGLVQYWEYGFIINQYELISAVIDGITIPSPKGDVDGNGQLNVNDVLFIVNIITGEVDPAPDQFWAADMNEDNRIDVLDVVELIQDILGDSG